MTVDMHDIDGRMSETSTRNGDNNSHYVYEYVTRHETYRERAVACTSHPESNHEWVSVLKNS